MKRFFCLVFACCYLFGYAVDCYAQQEKPLRFLTHEEMDALPKRPPEYAEAFSPPYGIAYVRAGAIDGKAFYCVIYDGETDLIRKSRLGLITDAGDYSELEFVGMETCPEESCFDPAYSYDGYTATKAVYSFRNKAGQSLQVEFRISDHIVAFRYVLPKEGDRDSVRILDDLTQFSFNDNPEHDFLKPYLNPAKEVEGYEFPGLFYLGSYEMCDEAWGFISETGSDSRYGKPYFGKIYETSGEYYGMMDVACDIEYASEPYLELPGATPWRIITVTEKFEEILHSMAASEGKKGIYVAEDSESNMKNLMSKVDAAAERGYRYLLVIKDWENNIGREGISELVGYAGGKGIEIFLCWGSTGSNAVDGSIWSDPANRAERLSWLKEIGVKGISVVPPVHNYDEESFLVLNKLRFEAADYGIIVYGNEPLIQDML